MSERTEKKSKFIIFAIMALASLTSQAGSLSVLTYHDVVPNTQHDNTSISRSSFVAQMDYLQQNGYTPVSLSFLDKVKAGVESLPEKPVLLTFDDGMRSYHDFVVPLLDIYQFPSVSSVVTGWLDGKNIPALYQGRLMNWKHLKSLGNNKLVEIISHTHNLHSSVRSNPQGNTEAASITRQYLPDEHAYESEALFHQRISRDLKLSIERISEMLGTPPRAIAWPYGYHNKTVTEIAENLGFSYQLTLEEGPTSFDKLPMVNRIILFATTSIRDFENELKYKTGFKDKLRFVEIELDLLMNKNYMQQEQLLSNMLDGLESLGINTVIVSPFTKDMSKSFFINDEYELASDILNRCLHLIKSKLPVRNVYLKLPGDPDLDDPDAFYYQLARLNWFNGVVFTDLPDSKKLSLVKSVLNRHQPRMQYGSYKPLSKQQNTTPAASGDFVIFTLTASELNNIDEYFNNNRGPGNTKSLILIKQSEDTGNDDISKAMRELRTHGYMHYGFSPFKYDLDQTASTQLVKELNQTSAGSGG